MSGIHRLRITAAPEVSAAMHADLATEVVAAQADGFSIGSPDVAFDESGFPLEGAREVTIPLQIKGARSIVGQVMRDIARAISVPDRWLMVQREATTDPVWYRITPKSPGDLDITNAYVDVAYGRWEWTLTLTVDSTAVGSRRSIPKRGSDTPTATVPNTGTSRGVVIDTPGEAPAPLRVDVRPSVAMNGRRIMISTFAVPWDSPLVDGDKPAIILDDLAFSSISGHSTRTSGASFLSGGGGITVTMDSTSNRQLAVTNAGSTWRPEPGRYLVLARLYREGSTGEAKIRMGQSWASQTALQPWRTWRPTAGGNRSSWMPVGYLQHPLGDTGEGLRPDEIMPPSIRFDLTPTVTSSALVHLDQVAFVPVDLPRGGNASACFAQFEDGIGAGVDFSFRIDGERRRAAIVDYTGQHHPTPQPLRTGAWPVATPGMATCVSVFLDCSDAPSNIEHTSTTSTLRVDTAPRLLHLGQER